MAKKTFGRKKNSALNRDWPKPPPTDEQRVTRGLAIIAKQHMAPRTAKEVAAAERAAIQAAAKAAERARQAARAKRASSLWL